MTDRRTDISYSTVAFVSENSSGHSGGDYYMKIKNFDNSLGGILETPTPMSSGVQSRILYKDRTFQIELRWI